MSKVYPDANYRAEVAAFMQSFSPGWRECVCRAKSGEDIPIRWANVRLADDTAIGIGVDLRDLHAAEQAVREREERLRLATSTADLGVFEWNVVSGNARWENDRMYEIFGRSRDQGPFDFRGFLDDCLDPRDRDLFEREHDLRSQGADTFRTRCRIRRQSDGALRWIEISGRFELSSDGVARRLVGVIADITEQRETQDRLEQFNRKLEGLVEQRTAELCASEEQYRALAENVRDVVYSIGADSQVLYLGPQVARYGYQPSEVAGRSFFDLIHEADREAMQVVFAERFRTGHTYDVEFRLRGAFGGVTWVEDRAEAIRNEQGEIAGVVGMLRDISERRRVEEESLRYQDRLRALAAELAVAEQQERDRLAALLHDDVCQLIIAAKLKLLRVLTLARQGAPTEEPADDLEAALDRALRSARSLTSRLSHPALRDLGLAPAVEWLAVDVRHLYGLPVNVRAPDDVDPMGYPKRVVLYQCIRELLTNAAKHAQAREVSVQIDWTKETVEGIIEDDGKGFDAQSVTTTADGGGFGLFSIRERLEAMGGEMTVTSREGQGTRIDLRMPIAHRVDKQDQPERPHP